jgi:hypothetical protein
MLIHDFKQDTKQNKRDGSYMMLSIILLKNGKLLKNTGKEIVHSTHGQKQGVHGVGIRGRRGVGWLESVNFT